MAVAYDRLGFVRGLQGATGEAIAAFQEAVRLDPQLFEARYHLGATLWWAERPADALPALREAVRLRPDHAEARYYLARALQQQGDLAAAVSASCSRAIPGTPRRSTTSAWRSSRRMTSPAPRPSCGRP